MGRKLELRKPHSARKPLWASDLPEAELITAEHGTGQGQQGKTMKETCVQQAHRVIHSIASHGMTSLGGVQKMQNPDKEAWSGQRVLLLRAPKAFEQLITYTSGDSARSGIPGLPHSAMSGVLWWYIPMTVYLL